MKINELISDFRIAMSNEEAEVLAKCKHLRSFDSFPERDQFILEYLIRKSLVSKIHKNGNILVLANDFTKP